MGYIVIVTNEGVFCIGGALSGVIIHHGLFIHGEWHNQAPNILRSYAGIFGCLAISRLLFNESDSTSRLASGLVVAILIHIVSLMASILVYRGFYHRLNDAKFPGPWWTRYTKIWQIWENRHSRNHIYLHKLYQKYGDVVRTGDV